MQYLIFFNYKTEISFNKNFKWRPLEFQWFFLASIQKGPPASCWPPNHFHFRAKNDRKTSVFRRVRNIVKRRFAAQFAGQNFWGCARKFEGLKVKYNPDTYDTMPHPPRYLYNTFLAFELSFIDGVLKRFRYYTNLLLLIEELLKQIILGLEKCLKASMKWIVPIKLQK